MKKGALSSRSRRLTSVDLPFLVGVLLLLGIGLATLYSAGYAKALQKTGNSYYYITRQGIYAVMGLVVMTVASWFPYRFYKKLSPWLYGICVTLLGAVLFLSNDSEKRWLYIGPIQFQPSEFAKVAVILLLAAYLSNPKLRIRNFWRGIVFPGVIFGVCAFLVGIEPHLSGAILVASIGLMMIIAAGANILQMVPIGLVCIIGGVALYFSEEYMQKRIQYWLHPELDPTGDGYQALQSLYAIGSGGLTGLGYGNSRQKYLYLPEPQNDFIFSVFCEEMGWIAAILVLGIFAFVIARGFYIAAKAPDKFSSLIVVGIISRLAVQTIFNIAVVSGAFPVTGISLPFFSYGGTALIVLLGEMGIVLQISRFASLEKDPPIKDEERENNGTRTVLASEKGHRK
ncbi:MAG: cell division protein FtsW [Clostridia bacterium]|nr:cell division protein FtsW [Clostridia bacterium]